MVVALDEGSIVSDQKAQRAGAYFYGQGMDRWVLRSDAAKAVSERKVGPKGQSPLHQSPCKFLLKRYTS